MLKGKTSLIKRDETRHNIVSLKVDGKIFFEDTSLEVGSVVFRNVSQTGLGVWTQEYVEPETSLKAVFGKDELRLKVVYSIFQPDKSLFLCGFKILGDERPLDILQMFNLEKT